MFQDGRLQRLHDSAMKARRSPSGSPHASVGDVRRSCAVVSNTFCPAISPALLEAARSPPYKSHCGVRRHYVQSEKRDALHRIEA